MSESKLHQACLGKVQAMREANVEPYAYTYDRTHSSGQLSELYGEKLEGGEEDESADVAVAGRIIHHSTSFRKESFGRFLQSTYSTHALTETYCLWLCNIGTNFYDKETTLVQDSV